MKRIFLVISLFVVLLNTISSQTIIKENDNNSTDSIQMLITKKQTDRSFSRIEIRYFGAFAEKKFNCTIRKDSIRLIKEWYEKDKGILSKRETIKNVELIDSLTNYIFFFFVEKNKYIILNPRTPGQMVETEKVSFDIIIHRKGYNPIKKDIYVEPDFTYSKEFLDFLELLDSF